MSNTVKIAVVYHSGYGHTGVQAKGVAEGAQSVAGAEVTLMAVEQVDWDATDAMIFGAPTYMGSISGQFKLFMEASSKIWYQRGWQDKIAAGFTNSGSQNGDKLSTLIQIALFAAQHGMTWVNLGLLPGNNSSQGSVNDLNRLGAFIGAMAQSNVDQKADVAPPQADQATARHLGKRVAEAALRRKAGAA
jgi:multimeric flavodoxin WrbA